MILRDDLMSLGWWRQYLGRSGAVSPSSERFYGALELGLASALAEMRSVYGECVDRAIRQFDEAHQRGRGREPKGLWLRVARAERTRRAVARRQQPPFLNDALWVAVTAESIRRTIDVPGGEVALRRLATAVDPEDIGFELVVASWLRTRIGGVDKVRVVPEVRGHKTPDLQVLLDNGAWHPVECKRQRDVSEADGESARASDAIHERLRSVLRRASRPVAINVSSLLNPDQALLDWCARTAKAALAELAVGTDLVVATHPNQKLRMRMALRNSGDPVVANAGGLLPGTVPYVATLTLPFPGHPIHHVVQVALAPRVAQHDLKRILDRAYKQVTGSAPGAVAVWTRAADDAGWQAVRSAVREWLHPRMHRRVSMIYLFGEERDRLFRPPHDLRTTFRVERLAHPEATDGILWPLQGVSDSVWD